MSGPQEFNDQMIAQFRATRAALEDPDANEGVDTSAGSSIILVHHRGAKSGAERVTPLMFLRENADTWLIAASKAGAPNNPHWYHNLVAHPEAMIETLEGDIEVHAEDLPGAARDAAWSKFKAANEVFAGYEAKTDRRIPVFALHRR